jgi:tetratricopeptide (TPR) repeat protein
MSTSSPATPEKVNYFKNGVIVMLTLVSVFAALVTLLQNYASLQSSDLAQQSSYTAVNATGEFYRFGLDAAQGTDVQQLHADYVQREVRADTKARALRMGGQTDLAAEYDLDARRWREAAQRVAESDPLLAEYGSDAALYRETLSRPAYVDEEREHTLLEQSRAWNSKANSYVAVLSTLSVALFLSGLSLTLSSRLRYLLAAAGAGLTAACALWVLVIFMGPVPVIPEEAIQRFVDGRIQYNLAVSRDEDPVDAIKYFDAAIDAAPEYARAYFYRSLANTDKSLNKRHLDTQLAIDDARTALKLGNVSSPVYGNLGWLYYLNGQYNTALQETRTALAMSPDECYLPFNNGLILLALQRADEAQSAYTEAIDCARHQASEYAFSYYMDVGVVDLTELAAANPGLAPTLEAPIYRLKESLASAMLFDDLSPRDIGQAAFGSVTFGGSVDSSDVVHDLATEFPSTQTTIYAMLEFEHVDPDQPWMTRWLLDGEEYLTTQYDQWQYGKKGTAWVSLYNYAGLNSGTYELDVFVAGKLVARGQVVVLPGNLPPMYYYTSSNVGVTVAYPTRWHITDLADNEVSVVAVRDPASETFFGVTSWVAATGKDDDIFQLFDLYQQAVQGLAGDFHAETRERFPVAGRDGWIVYYHYTNPDGIPIEGALAGTIDADSSLTFIVVIETAANEWKPQVDLINAMLDRMIINR